MPINFKLEKIRKEHNCNIYFETGLGNPENNTISCKKALSCKFDKVYTIEIDKKFIESAKDIFKTQLKSDKLTIIDDDSSNIKKYINNKLFEESKILFFLDAHPIGDTHFTNYSKDVQKRCPIFDELEAIKQMKNNDNVIMIDDLRMINKRFPWKEKSYGDIDFLKKIKEVILSINNNYVFKTLDGHIKNDILFAYVPLQKNDAIKKNNTTKIDNLKKTDNPKKTNKSNNNTKTLSKFLCGLELYLFGNNFTKKKCIKERIVYIEMSLGIESNDINFKKRLENIAKELELDL